MKSRRRLNMKQKQGGGVGGNNNGNGKLNDDRRKKSAEFPKTELHNKVGVVGFIHKTFNFSNTLRVCLDLNVKT